MSQIPILIAIPFWSGDRSEAIELCKIIAGIQPHHVGNVANVLLVARQDCPIDNYMVDLVRPKFTTFSVQSMSPLKGWPMGANGMFAFTMQHISNLAQQQYECVYWMEPDAIPLCPNWFWDLVLEWRSRHPSVNVVGCRADCNGDGTGDHITGCAVYHPNIARIMPEISICHNQAWDYEHRAKIVQMGKHTPCIQNWYKATNASEGMLDLVNQGVRVVHGFKDRSLTNLVKKKYNIP